MVFQRHCEQARRVGKAKRAHNGAGTTKMVGTAQGAFARPTVRNGGAGVLL
jgi:hypothetical protein